MPASSPVQVRVFNLTHVPDRDLSRAEAEIAGIFAGADIAVHWAEGSLDDRAPLAMDFSNNNSSPAGCRAPGSLRELRVQLLPHAPRGIAFDTLGFSLPCARFGIDSTIFIDHCERVTRYMPATFTTVLAYSIAHELGHVLLASAHHSTGGLMRGVWDSKAWLGAMRGDIRIDREQARRMRMRLFSVESLHPSVPSR